MLADNKNRQPRMRMGAASGNNNPLVVERAPDPTQNKAKGANIMSGLDELEGL